MKARFVDTYKGRKVFEYPVVVDTVLSIFESVKAFYRVKAFCATHARDLIYRQYKSIPQTSIEVYGPKGGIAAKSYIGWYSAVGNALVHVRDGQTEFAF